MCLIYVVLMTLPENNLSLFVERPIAMAEAHDKLSNLMVK